MKAEKTENDRNTKTISKKHKNTKRGRFEERKAQEKKEKTSFLDKASSRNVLRLN